MIIYLHILLEYLKVFGIKNTLGYVNDIIVEKIPWLNRFSRYNSKKNSSIYQTYVHEFECQKEKVRLEKFENVNGSNQKLIVRYILNDFVDLRGESPKFLGHRYPIYSVGGDIHEDKIQSDVKMAQESGIYGFSFYIESSFDIKSLSKNILKIDNEFKYCLEYDIEQLLKMAGLNCKEDLTRFIYDTVQMFERSHGYILVNNKPLVLLHNAGICFTGKDIKVFEKNFFVICSDDGYTNPISTYVYEELFNANFLKKCGRVKYRGYVVPKYKAILFDLDLYLKKYRHLNGKSKMKYRTICCGYDDTSNHEIMDVHRVIQKLSPELYGFWLNSILCESNIIHTEEDNFVFFQSWNDYKNGMVLEPNDVYGNSFLKKTAEVINKRTIGFNTNSIVKKIKENKERLIKNNVCINCIGSLGDVISCEPIARFIKSIDEKCEITWVVKGSFAEVVRYNPNVSKVVEVEGLKQSIEYCIEAQKEGNILIDCHYDRKTDADMLYPHVNYNNFEINDYTYLDYGGLLTTFALAAGLPPLKDAPIFWTKKDLKVFDYGKYVTIHCKSANSKKDWVPAKWKSLCEHIIDMGFNVVEVGMEQITVVESDKYFNCTHIHDLQQIAEIIKNSSVFIGIDSAFAHIANCFNIKSVLIYGEYNNLINYMVYTGPFSDGKTATIVQPSTGGASEVKETDVFMAFLEKIGIEE